MRDVLGPGTVLGYCTNVHAGRTWPELRESLDRIAVRVKAEVSPNMPLGVGLWLSADAAARANWVEIADWLGAKGLLGFTVNAFPFADFHQPVVKHDVYEPNWADKSRQHFTQLLPAYWSGIGVDADQRALSISTLPLGWTGRVDVAAAADRLRSICDEFAQTSPKAGVHWTIDLEPEPGCILDTCDDVIAFFDEHLPDEVHRRHIGVCHDVCHAAVMFEDQEEVLRRYAEAGIRVNKVQVSSCPRVPAGDAAALDALRAFVEPRYLHQTVVRLGDGGMKCRPTADQWFFEDLPDALAALDDPREAIGLGAGEWRTHFHVPVYMDRIGPLATTRDQIMPAILAARKYHDTKFFEVETYAWGVLPEAAKEAAWNAAPQDEWLAEGIARELLWVKREAEKAGLSVK